jgi:hypothetical protein
MAHPADEVLIYSFVVSGRRFRSRVFSCASKRQASSPMGKNTIPFQIPDSEF